MANIEHWDCFLPISTRIYETYSGAGNTENLIKYFFNSKSKTCDKSECY